MPRFPSNAACFSIRHLSNRLTTDIEMSKGFRIFLGVADPLMKCSSNRRVTFARVILRRSARPPRLHVAFDRAPLR